MGKINLKQKIAKVNKVLLAGEPGNVSVDSARGYIGYDIQHVIDAMNAVFGAEGWSFKTSDGVIHEGPVSKLIARRIMVVDVKVKFYVKVADGEWAGAEAAGQSEVERGNVGDAKKAATADGLKKALSYVSIGSRAYLGLLTSPDITMAGTLNEHNVETVLKQIFEPLKCDKCSVGRLTIAQAEFAQQVYGKIICADCQTKVNKKNQKNARNSRKAGK